MFRRILMASALAAGLGVAAQAALAAPDDAAMASAWRDLKAGVDRADVPTLLKAKEEFAMLSGEDPAFAPARSAVALAAWRTVVLLNGEKTAAQARAMIDEGLAQCDALLLKDDHRAVALALKGSLQALLIEYEPDEMMTLGPESGANLQKAARLAPTNPRVALLHAIYTLHAPSFAGGGADKALPELVAATRLFEADAPGDSTSPAWGRDDALLWAGRAEAQLGHADVARTWYRKALEVNPSNGWARVLLKPAADSTRVGKP